MRNDPFAPRVTRQRLLAGGLILVVAVAAGLFLSAGPGFFLGLAVGVVGFSAIALVWMRRRRPGSDTAGREEAL